MVVATEHRPGRWHCSRAAPQRSRAAHQGLTQPQAGEMAAAAGTPGVGGVAVTQGTPFSPCLPSAAPSPRQAPLHATSYLQVTCLVQPPPPSWPTPPPPAPGDGAVTVGIGVGEAAATTAAAAPAPDVVAVVPGAAASAITVYPTQQWPRNFRDHIVPVRLREGEGERGRGAGRGRRLRCWLAPTDPASRLLELLPLELRAWSVRARGPPPAPDWWSGGLSQG